MNKHNLLKKITLFGLAATLMISVLAGCGAKTTTETSAPTTAAQAGSTDATESKAASGKIEEIEFYQMKPEAVDIYNEIIARFEKENPNIKVNQNNVPDPRTVLQTRLASNDVPDIILTYPNETEFKLYVSEGYMMDISGTDALKNIKTDILDTIKIDGKDYSMPLSINTTGVFYNKAIFKEQGIAIPTTYDELIAACDKLKAAGITPFALSDKDNWTVGILANLMVGMEMGKSTADSLFADVLSGKQTFDNNPEMNLIADRLIQLRTYGSADAAGTDINQAIATFTNGQAAMLFNGIWENPVITKANPSLDYGMFPFPGTTADKTAVIFGIDSAFSVSATTQHKDASLKFLAFLSSTETAQYFADNDKSPSCVIGVTAALPAIQELVKLLDAGKSFEWMHFKWPAGMENTFNTDFQTLVTTKDKAGFFTLMNQDFKAAGQK